MRAKRTEQIWIRGDKSISRLCQLSNNLYNEANYIIRQSFFDSREWIRYNELNSLLKESENYKALPAQTAQQILRLVEMVWSSFFKAMKEWRIHPERFKARPRIPGYKEKGGEFMLVFTNQQAKLRGGWLILPKKVGLKVRTRIKEGLREVRIIPKGIGYVVEIVYEKEKEMIKRDRNRIVGIDLGSSNIVTMVNNIGEKPIVVKDGGTRIKSINQFYNKHKVRLHGIYDLQGIKEGKRMKQLVVRRERGKQGTTHTS